MSFENWSDYRLGDLIIINQNSISKKFTHKEIEYYDTSSVTENKFLEPIKVNIENAPSRAKRIVHHNDIVISTVRPSQRHYGIIKYPKENTVVSTGFAVLTAKKIDPVYLYYYLTQDDIVEYLNSIAEGSTTTFPAFNPSIIDGLRLRLPSIRTQNLVARILSSLDDKIELNRQTNQTLEAIAQALFKEWFVNFNFPGATGEMQESELGEIPKGWRVYKVGELVDSVSITHKFSSDKVIFLNTSDIEEGKILHRNYSSKGGLPGQAKKSIKKLDILFTEIRPANKRYAFIDFDAEDYVVSTKLMVLRSISKFHPIIAYNFLISKETLSDLQHLAESRSGTFPQITFSQVKELKMVLPTDNIAKQYEDLAWAIFKQIKSNEEQIESLTALRDILLPKLMKGEISIKESEKQTADAL